MADNKQAMLLAILIALVAGIAVLQEHRIKNMENALLEKRCSSVTDFGDFRENVKSILSNFLQELNSTKTNISGGNLLTKEDLKHLKTYIFETVKFEENYQSDKLENTEPDLEETSDGWTEFLIVCFHWIYTCVFRLILLFEILFSIFLLFVKDDTRLHRCCFLFIGFAAVGVQPLTAISRLIGLDETSYYYFVCRFLVGPYKVIFGIAFVYVMKVLIMPYEENFPLETNEANKRTKTLKKSEASKGGKNHIPLAVAFMAGISLYSGFDAYALWT